MHRAAFEDTREPSRVFTTSHFGSFKYRPLNRVITLLTYWIGHGNPAFFRIRNVAFHLLNVILVYFLGWLLFKCMLISSIGAALFGLHPLVNQSVVGAVWTNTIGHTWFLLALLIFIVSARAKRLQMYWLVVSLISGWLSLLIYDSGFITYAMMIVYLILYFLIHRERSVSWQFIGVFAAGSIILMGPYFLLRAFFVPHGWQQAAMGLPSVDIIVKNIGMYGFALLLPIDSILANEWLHTPLPSEIELNVSIVIIIGVFAFAMILLMAHVTWQRIKRKEPATYQIDWLPIVFVICGIFTPLLPVVLFSGNRRPSETYLYLPVAFYTVLLSYGLTRLLASPKTRKSQASYTAAVLVLLGLFCTATWVRNEKVVQCGETVHRILSSLPNKLLTEGNWTLSFANFPGEQISRRYGFYGFHGTDTIGDGGMANHTIQSALQLTFKNKLLTGKVVKAEELTAVCEFDASSRHLCFLVHWDGRVEELQW
jgi:hypothetical protein